MRGAVSTGRVGHTAVGTVAAAAVISAGEGRS